MNAVQVAELKSNAEIFTYPDGRMDSKNAASYLGKSPKTLAMMRSKGTGPRYIKRGRIFYFKEELDVWIREGEATSTTQSRLRLLKAGE